MTGVRNIEATGKWYAIATDKFLSGWGMAINKSYFAVACNTLDQAQDIVKRMKTRSDFIRVRIGIRPPRTKENDHLHVIPYNQFSYGK